MRITLTVVAGPHQGLEFSFARHDTFLVGRSRHAHFQLPTKDKYFSRIHFMVEVNPPQCRLIDMGSHNGTYVNGGQILTADLKDGDEIRAGHTVLRLSLAPGSSDVAVPMATPKPGKARTIPGYKVIREIGRGSMGVVYEATRLADKATVALKTIAPAAGGTPKQIEAFLRETSVLTQLDHPYIVRFYERGHAHGLLFFSSEYVSGTDAGRIVEQDGPLAVKRAVRLVSQALRALEYAHGLKLIHRDIKPANLLVNREGGKEAVKVADFGLARLYQASQLSGLTMLGDARGSAAFMPPEQITNYRAAEPPADQYATAATLYTLLTGKHVFNLPKEIHRQFSLILEAQPVPIQDRRPDISPALAAVIHKALARNPAQRFATVTEFRRALVKAAV